MLVLSPPSFQATKSGLWVLHQDLGDKPHRVSSFGRIWEAEYS